MLYFQTSNIYSIYSIGKFNKRKAQTGKGTETLLTKGDKGDGKSKGKEKEG